MVKTKKTELLFLALVLRLLRPGGRAAVIVPDGVLFGSSTAHKPCAACWWRITSLDGIVSMPLGGVFRALCRCIHCGSWCSPRLIPAARITSGSTTCSLMATRWTTSAIRWVPASTRPTTRRTSSQSAGNTGTRRRAVPAPNRASQCPRPRSPALDYDLSINRYKQVVHEAKYDPPHGDSGRVEGVGGRDLARGGGTGGDAQCLVWLKSPRSTHALIVSKCAILTELASFVPMANVSRGGIRAITTEESRQVGELLKGFTPFVDRDVLVAKITPCFENGKIAHARISKRQGFGSTEFHVIRPASQRLDDRYLFHFLRQPRIRIEGERRMTGSAGQRRVPKAYLESLEIPMPPIAEQRRIAAILDKGRGFARQAPRSHRQSRSAAAVPVPRHVWRPSYESKDVARWDGLGRCGGYRFWYYERKKDGRGATVRTLSGGSQRAKIVT